MHASVSACRARTSRTPLAGTGLLMLAAFAQGLLTRLGAASEAAGLDRYLKVNTAKKRTHSLFREGAYWYSALPNLREERLRPPDGSLWQARLRARGLARDARRNTRGCLRYRMPYSGEERRPLLNLMWPLVVDTSWSAAATYRGRHDDVVCRLIVQIMISKN